MNKDVNIVGHIAKIRYAKELSLVVFRHYNVNMPHFVCLISQTFTASMLGQMILSFKK